MFRPSLRWGALRRPPGPWSSATAAHRDTVPSTFTNELHREVGVYPETKHSTYFQSIDLDLETPLVRQVRGAGLDKAKAPIFIQSFELTNLVGLRQHFGVNARLAFLTSASGAPYDLVSTGDPRTGTDSTAYGRAIDEQVTYLRTGIDGLFTDQADIGVVARAEFLAAQAAA